MQALEKQLRYKFQYYRKLLQYIRKVKYFYPNKEYKEQFIHLIKEAMNEQPRNSELVSIIQQWENWSLRRFTSTGD